MVVVQFQAFESKTFNLYLFMRKTFTECFYTISIRATIKQQVIRAEGNVLSCRSTCIIGWFIALGDIRRNGIVMPGYSRNQFSAKGGVQ